MQKSIEVFDFVFGQKNSKSQKSTARKDRKGPHNDIKRSFSLEKCVFTKGKGGPHRSTFCTDAHRHTDTHKHAQTRTDTHRHAQRRTETHRDTQRHRDTQGDTQRHIETHGDTLRHTETH